ncbi:MAG TPA: DMT family transporter [Candidatus Anaerostipes avistercoris]|uniref:DMT family transporter n=1 Tax=Candidatus Anaerostipes avistercoris TaxID=2838462 RepID=A0A9D2PH26_9FIRM|nr:DMT family transporter [Candidatus Anaerostipes avistercoris]
MSQNTKGICFAVIGGTCWGLSGVMGKYLFDERQLTAVWLVTVRLLAAGILMLALAWTRKRNGIFDVWKRKDSAVSQFIFCIFGMAACQMSYFLAVQYSNPGTATVLQYLGPVLIMIFCLVRDRRLPRVLELAVLASVIIGVFLLATHGQPGNLAVTEQALFWGLMSAVTCAVYNIQPEKLLKEFGTLETVGWGMLAGGVLAAPVMRIWEVPGTWDSVTFLMMAGVIIIGTVVAFGCYLHGVALLGPVRGSLFGCVEPMAASILSAVVLGQVFETMDILGMVCIIAGVTSLAVFDRK